MPSQLGFIKKNKEWSFGLMYFGFINGSPTIAHYYYLIGKF
jgi:hypothetical protein